jgi:hypothetical protein
MIVRVISALAACAALGIAISSCATAGPIIDDSTPPPGTDGGPRGGGDAATCATKCGGVCTNTSTDATNCGACGKACPAMSTCTASKCVCSKGSLCAGACVDTQTDANNCGSCGNACSDAGAGMWSCVAGQCTLGCSGGQTACGATCVDLTSTDTHCGSCSTDCTVSSQSCCTSACVDTTTDKNNCGACGKACSGTMTCVASTCKSPCDGPGIGTCSHQPCLSGSALVGGCDSAGCVTSVCSADSFCCSTSWDSICVGEVTTYCGYTCVGC